MRQSTSKQEETRRKRNRKPPDPDAATWTIAEAARLMGIGTSTAYALINQDEFPVRVINIGATKKVLKADLTRYLEGEAG